MASLKKKPESAKKKAQNKKNLHPIKKGTRSKDEVKRVSAKGGRNSGKSRRETADLRKAIQDVMKLPMMNGKTEAFKSIQDADGKNLTVTKAIAARMAVNAMNGDTKSIQMMLDASGSSADQEEIEIKRKEFELKEAELKIKQEQHDAEMAELQERKNHSEPVYRGIPALSIAPAFLPIQFDIEEHKYIEYVEKGGRGSSKSSHLSLNVIDLMMKHPDLNALVMRNVANTLRGSVYNQIVWAINELGLYDEFKCTTSPCEITRVSTGQKIFFRGADDPGKVKSIKPVKGYIGIIWFEELDQYAGPETVRNIEQSAMRGGDLVWIFKSFNPPKSANNWANEYVLKPKDNRIVMSSDYRTVPKKWLGKNWLDEAEELQKLNPVAYDNEYLGAANGTGGSVFDNVTIRVITAEERKQFDRIYEGVDWGWFPDPFHFSRMYYNAAAMKLYIYGELRCNNKGNEETAKLVRDKFDIKDSHGDYIQSVDDGIVYCDSAEKKSTADWRSFGMPARDVEKGPGSVDYSMKWIQRLTEIIIDPVDCPATAKEFTHYEYARDKDGNIITGYPDKDNHAIDSVRYAMFPVWRKRGQ
jgi:PBSX family phage terminase large subunit